MRAMCQSPPCTHTTPRAHHPCRAATDNTAHRLLPPTPPRAPRGVIRWPPARFIIGGARRRAMTPTMRYIHPTEVEECEHRLCSGVRPSNSFATERSWTGARSISPLRGAQRPRSPSRPRSGSSSPSRPRSTSPRGRTRSLSPLRGFGATSPMRMASSSPPLSPRRSIVSPTPMRLCRTVASAAKVGAAARATDSFASYELRCKLRATERDVRPCACPPPSLAFLLLALRSSSCCATLALRSHPPPPPLPLRRSKPCECSTVGSQLPQAATSSRRRWVDG